MFPQSCVKELFNTHILYFGR